MVMLGKDGVLKQQDFFDYLVDELQEDESLEIEYANLYGGKLISEKENIELFASIDTTALTSEILYKILNPSTLEYIIEYSSTYGEKWNITNASSVPVKLN